LEPGSAYFGNSAFEKEKRADAKMAASDAYGLHWSSWGGAIPFHDFSEPGIIWPNEIRDLIRICRLHKILFLKTIVLYAHASFLFRPLQKTTVFAG
jgi:hypothetical protein